MLPGRKDTSVDFAQMAWRRRWVMLGSLILGAYVALVVSSRLQDVYQSEMLIQVVPQTVPNSYVQSTVTMRTADRINSLAQQVMSRTALEGVIQKMDLYPEERRRLPMQDVVELMRNFIKIQVVNTSDNQADAFYVRFSYLDREVATRVTERLGGLFIDLNALDRGNIAEATNQFLVSQLAETRGRLEQQEQKLEEFRQRNAGRLPSQLNFNMQAIQSTQLAVQALVESLARDRDRKSMLQRLYDDAEAEAAFGPESPVVPAQPNDPAAVSGQTAQQQLAAAREALARLQIRLTPEHPDIARAKRVIQELEHRASEEIAKQDTTDPSPGAVAAMTPEQRARRGRSQQTLAEIESLDRQIRFKEAEEQRLRATVGDYQRRTEEIPGVESEWIALTRDYDTQQAAYRDLLTKSEQSQVAVELERRQIGEQFRVLDPARPPIRPVGVRRLQVNGIGAFAGLALGIALAALLEYRDTTFHSGDDVLDVISLPVLATVPYVMVGADRIRTRRMLRVASVAVALLVLAGGYGVWALRLWNYVV